VFPEIPAGHWRITRLLLLLLFGLLAGQELAGATVLPTQKSGLTAAQVVANPELLHSRLRAKNLAYRNQAEFVVDPVMGLVGDLSQGGVEDLSPLQGIPFGALDLKGLAIADLSPLKGMPLEGAIVYEF
jgi:hypothetical protein